MPKKGIRPHTWKSGPDPLEHRKHRIWIQQKNQAQWREEGWSISFEEWKELWSELWHLRGRERGDYCMSRIDWSLPWTIDNVDIIPRSIHAKRQQAAKVMGWRSIAQKRYLSQKELV